MHEATQDTVLDFTGGRDADGWHAIDDRIMGGRSQSSAEQVEGVGLSFAGEVSLDNNGGFASIRSAAGSWDLGRYKGLRLRVRGDGKRYKLSLRTDRFYDGVSYQAAITTRAGAWEEIDLPFADFAPTHHGIRLTTVAPLNTAGISSFGLFIADRQAGPFRLDVAWVRGI